MFNKVKLQINLGNKKKLTLKYKILFREMVWIIGRHAFLFLLMLLLLDICFGLFLFYRNVISTNQVDISLIGAPQGFQETTYQAILKEWDDRQILLDDYLKKHYNNPF